MSLSGEPETSAGTSSLDNKSIQQERAGSPVPSYVSMKSDNSMGMPITFSGGFSGDPSGACPGVLARDFCTERERVDEWLEQNHPTPASAEVPPPPGKIQFSSVESDSVSLSWEVPEGVDIKSLRFSVTCISDTEQRNCKVIGVNHIKIQSLSAGKEYTFNVATIGDKGTQSQHVSATVTTVIPKPLGLRVDSVTMTSLSLCWSEPHGLDQTPRFLVSYCSPGTKPQPIFTASCSTVLLNLQPGTQYTVNVCTVLENGEQSEAISQTIYTGSGKREHVRIVLVGKTGVGKSESGNTILGREEFESEFSSASVTSQCEKKRGEVDGRELYVIDTPGLFDTNVSNATVTKEITKCISLSSPGPHVFLVIIQLDRFIQEEQETVKMIQEIFGEESVKYTMALFTHGKRLKKKKITIEEFLSKNKDLAKFTSQCRGRYHVFNNKDMENCSQVTELLQKIDKMVTLNGGGYYTTEMYQKVEAAIEEEKKRILKETEEKRNREKEELIKQLEEEAKEKLKKDLEELKRKNEKEADDKVKKTLEELEEKNKTEAEKKKKEALKNLEEKQEREAREKAEEDNSFIGRCTLWGAVTGGIAGMFEGATTGAVAGPAGMAAGAAIGAVGGAALGAGAGAAGGAGVGAAVKKDCTIQ